jgi:hypothetical protein
MGIFDDAIRQHLELKRQRGATESELKQLEDEAFGPPSRPGEPDFPDSDEPHEQSGNGAAADAAAPESSPAALAPEASAEPSASEQALVEPPPEPAEPAVEQEPPEEEEEEASVEPTPESEELTAVYDQTAGRQVDLEDLERELEATEPEPTEAADDHPEGGVEPAEPARSAPAEAPVESLDTVEHALPEEAIEPEEPVADQEDGEEDDVLADTPEFLRDSPEDDELWFEQREPKDFDF